MTRMYLYPLSSFRPSSANGPRAPAYSRRGRPRPAWCRARSQIGRGTFSPALQYIQWTHCLMNSVTCTSMRNQTGVFRQPLESSHGTTMVGLLHMSTHQPHLMLVSSSRNPEHRVPNNMEPKEALVIQGDVTIVRHETLSPQRAFPDWHAELAARSEYDSHPPREQILPSITVPCYVHDSIIVLP